MAEMSKEELSYHVYQKLKDENEGFLQHILSQNLSPDDLVKYAYQIVYQNEVLHLLTENTVLRKGKWQALMDASYPVLNKLYKALLENDGYTLDIATIAEAIDTWATQEQERTAKNFFADPHAPLYTKNQDEALQDGEIAFWREDFKLSQRCAEEFCHLAERSSSQQARQEQLPKWQSKYGQARCLQVLTCMLEHREIFSDDPIIEQAMDSMANERKRLKGHIRWVAPDSVVYLDKTILLHATKWIAQHPPIMEKEQSSKLQGRLQYLTEPPSQPQDELQYMKDSEPDSKHHKVQAQAQGKMQEKAQRQKREQQR